QRRPPSPVGGTSTPRSSTACGPSAHWWPSPSSPLTRWRMRSPTGPDRDRCAGLLSPGQDTGRELRNRPGTTIASACASLATDGRETERVTRATSTPYFSSSARRSDRGTVSGASRLVEYQIHDPAAAHMRPRTPEVREDVGAVAARIFEGVGKDGEPVGFKSA